MAPIPSGHANPFEKVYRLDPVYRAKIDKSN
jgi:hypothetical protein